MKAGPILDSFQQGNCRFQNCRRAHVCRRCRGRYTDVGSVITIKSPLHLGAWEPGLKLHPDESFVEYILDDIKHGVSISYEGPRESVTSKNWPSTKHNISAIKQSVQNDISKGRKAGPFKITPFATIVGSPMGAFRKKSSHKYRADQSVNSYISDDSASVDYISIDTVVQSTKG